METRDLPEQDALHRQQALHALDRKWTTLHEAANAVAALGGISAEPAGARELPAAGNGLALNRIAEPWIEDMTAMMEPGIIALLAVRERGADPQPAARALWLEFVHARDSLLEMAALQARLHAPGNA